MPLDAAGGREYYASRLVSNSKQHRKRCVLTLARVAEVLEARAVVAAPSPDPEVTGCFAADLMSDVLAFARPEEVLLTGLATDQAIRTAAVRHLQAVFVVEDKEISAEMVEAARDEGIPLFRTVLSTYEACGRLMQAGLPPSRHDRPSACAKPVASDSPPSL